MHMYVYALAFNSLFEKCVRFIVDFLSYQKDKQWSGTDTIKSHTLPSKPKGNN